MQENAISSLMAFGRVLHSARFFPSYSLQNWAAIDQVRITPLDHLLIGAFAPRLAFDATPREKNEGP